MEIKCAELTKCLHKTFSAEITCRFPRVQRIRYDDKEIEKVLTMDELREMMAGLYLPLTHPLALPLTHPLALSLTRPHPLGLPITLPLDVPLKHPLPAHDLPLTHPRDLPLTHPCNTPQGNGFRSDVANVKKYPSRFAKKKGGAVNGASGASSYKSSLGTVDNSLTVSHDMARSDISRQGIFAPNTYMVEDANSFKVSNPVTNLFPLTYTKMSNHVTTPQLPTKMRSPITNPPSHTLR